jgi:hypothetical protein
MMDIYIIMITSKTLSPECLAGAIYTNATDATKEVDRLQAANTFTKAWWVVRHLEVPATSKAVGWGHE